MGYMRHHAIIVTCWKEEAIVDAHRKADVVFSGYVTPIVDVGMNGYRSFLVPPDGSKEGWEESIEGDKLREKFKTYLRSTRYDDGSNLLDWCEVQYGDDERVTLVVDDSDADRRDRQ